MDVTPLVRSGLSIIQSYSGGRFRISGTLYEQAVIVSAETVVPWDGAADFEMLDMAALAFLAGQCEEMDVVLLGCGARMCFLPPEFSAFLKGRGVHAEVMDTGAACRTYNVLLAEGRRVGAALLPAG